MNGKPVGEASASVRTSSVAGAQPGQEPVAQLRGQARVGAQREDRADLDAGRAGGHRGLDGLGGAQRSGEPERQADRGDLADVRLVPGSEHRLAALVAHRATPRRGVVAARAGALDDEAVGPDRGVTGEVGGEDLAGDDREEQRPVERRQTGAEEVGRVDLTAWSPPGRRRRRRAAGSGGWPRGRRAGAAGGAGCRRRPAPRRRRRASRRTPRRASPSGPSPGS